VFGAVLSSASSGDAAVFDQDCGGAGGLDGFDPDLHVEVRGELGQLIHGARPKQRAVSNAKNAKLRFQRNGHGNCRTELFSL